jgi:hypothetical protein
VPWAYLSQELGNNGIMAKIYYCTNQAKIVFQKKKKEKILYPKSFYINSKGFKCFFGKRKPLAIPFYPKRAIEFKEKITSFVVRLTKIAIFPRLGPNLS